MNNKFLNLFITILLVFGSERVYSQNELHLNKDLLPVHPRILLLKGEEAAILKTIGSDATWKAVHESIIAKCETIMDRPPVERILTGRRLLDKSREALRRIFYLSYSYRMTGDKKYFARAEKEMVAIAAFTDWNPSHFLDVAEMTMAMSIGYDWLFGSLPENSRKLIRDAIIEKGLNPSLDSRYNSWLRNSNNWNQVCNAGMTYGALAVYEDQPELAANIIDRACKSIILPMEDYQPDGAYPEGYGYWGYGTSFNIMFISAWEKAFSKKFEAAQYDGFLKTGGYLENMTGPLGVCFNYSDCDAGGGIHAAMYWIANRINDPGILWAEKGFMKNIKNAGDRLLPAIMIWSGGLKMDRIAEPAKKIWTGQGKNPVALMRTSWKDPDAIYIAMKGGSPKVNHGHMDVGTFVMESDGVRWAMDFGPQDYNSLEQRGIDLWNMSQNSQRWEVLRYNNFVHNTLTVNGQLQQVAGYAPITSSSDDPLFMNAVTDMTKVYAGQLKSVNRGIAIVDEKYVTVRDEVETLPGETVIRWSLLTNASVSLTGTNSAELTKNGKKLTIKVAEPVNVKMKTWSTAPAHDYDSPNPGTIVVGFEAVLPANSKSVLQVFLLPQETIQSQSSIPGTLSTWPKL
jgi:hypothetical protein